MPAAWINEFHYDNASTDVGEFVEIAAAAGTDLTGWTIVLYNGNDGKAYGTRTLSGIVPDQQNGFGTISLSYPSNGIQNGAPDAIALVDPAGNVVEFISYEGVMTAVDGPAAGMTSTDVGVLENGSQNGTSIGRVGTGDEASEFSWALISDDTPGGVNAGQSFTGTVSDRPGTFSIDDASVVEGNSGTTAITFTVTRGMDSNVAASVDYSIALPGGAGGASASDFASPVLAGTLTFAAGEFSKTITLDVRGDGVSEGSEAFTVTLSNASNGAALGDAEAIGTILDDDAAVVPGTPFINEIHYDNTSTDVGEGIEIAAPAGTDLTGWSLVLYSVSSGATLGTVYNTRALSGVVADQDDGYGTIAFTWPTNGIQNGPNDGVALVDPQGNVVQFLSYEGSFTAGNGPAAGLTSTDIGVSEGSTPVGFSLQVVGSGASAADFTWSEASDDSFGSVNAGQDFIAADATGLVRVDDASVVEGDAGETMLVFTVTRAGGLGSEAGVDWVLGLHAGGTDLADLGAGQPLMGHVEFAPGVASVQIAIAVSGDTLSEGNETLEIRLVNQTGNISVVDGEAIGTIVNDDPLALAIYEIQGEGHRSAYVGQPVTTTGIVTGVIANGFYLQDAAGDGNARTSDAIFVYTGGAATVAVGDAAEVRGSVEEYIGGEGSLSVTELDADQVTILSSGNALPAAVRIGEGGLTPPSAAIDDDGLASYDPLTDGIDFYESLEGMRVTIDQPIAVTNTTSFGETFVVASGGAGATGLNDRNGMTISEGDYNPEKIQIDATTALYAGYNPNHSQGDLLGDVTGIVSYSFNSYEVLVTEAVTVREDVTLARETTDLVGGRDHLTIANYNVENLSPTDTQEKFDLLASDIVYSLAAPDIIGLQEMQDGNGLNGSDPLSAIVTAQLLIDAIAAIGGPNYVYVEVAPSASGSTGGQSGGNIRNGFLYNADRVGYVDGSAVLIEDPAFAGSRRPLVGDFTFNGETVRLINVHFTARLGSDPLWGATQPASDAGDASRTAQAQAVSAYVNESLATNPALQLGVMGDFNGFYWEDAVETVEGGVLTDLHHLLNPEERYTYQFEGNYQAIDHLIVSGGLAYGAEFDVVHINAGAAPGTPRGSDHDPIVGRFFIEAPNAAPVAVDDAIAVDEDGTTGNLWNLLLGNDSDLDPEDSHAIAAVDGSGALGSLVFDPATQTLRYVADGDAFDALAPGETAVDTFTYTVTDQHGATDTATVSVTVTGIDDGVSRVGGNGKDVLAGTAGEDVLDGGNGNDWLLGEGGHDILIGGNGSDRLEGGAGNDDLDGGRGSDLLVGGAGADVFRFGRGGGDDMILDFEVGVDTLSFEGFGVKSWRFEDANGDGVRDLSIAFTGGAGSVTLIGVSDISGLGLEMQDHAFFF